MKRPAVFFDRDNTLIASDGYLGDPAKVTLLEGAADAVAHARRLGYAVVVISNQSGVARGMFSEEDVSAVNARTDELLAAENPQAIIDRHEFCPFHPEGTVDVYARESDRRKPKPGMIFSAAEKLALDLPRSWIIGDAGRDIEAGKAAGCRAILFTDPSVNPSPAALQSSSAQPDYTVTTLKEALQHIEQNPEPSATSLAQPTANAQSAYAPTSAASNGPTDSSPSANTSRAESAAATSHDEPEPSAPIPTAPRVPKVAIGSKYVPPEGGRATVNSARLEAAERSTARRPATRPEPDPTRPAPTPPNAAPGTASERVESLLEQICLELRRQNDHHDGDFSVSKLLAGIVQVIVLAILFLAYLKRLDPALPTYLMLALILQTMTISLLIMSRQK